MNHGITKGTAARTSLLAALSAAPMFAQGPISSVAAGISSEAISIVHYGAIVAVIGMAVWMFKSHDHGIVGRLVAAIVGLFIALNPQTFLSWIQSL